MGIDGVLNNFTDAEYHEFGQEHKKDRLFYSVRCVKLLNELTDKSGAKIVVSSTWRLGETDESMKLVLEGMGITGEYIGMTGREAHLARGVYRGNEIISWIHDNEDLCGNYFRFRNFVILDDDSDMLLWQKDNYVNCDPEIGMTNRTLFRALAILNNAPCEDIGQEFTS